MASSTRTTWVVLVQTLGAASLEEYGLSFEPKTHEDEADYSEIMAYSIETRRMRCQKTS